MAETPAPAWTPLEIVKDLSQGGMVDAAYWRAVSARHLSFVRSWAWPTDAKTLDGVDADLVEAYAWGEQALILRNDAVIRLAVGGECELRVAAHDRAAAAAIHTEFARRFPLSESSDNEVPVIFWWYSPHGPQSVSRRIAATDWESIDRNYTAPVREKLARLMDGYTPSQAGQLILWQGVPGTGKTWALRALAWQWRDWASFHYVVDPDKLFGDHADYLIQVLLHHGPEVVLSQPGVPDPPAKERWRVLVLEDTGELLAADAKRQTGQALSRLLNVVDGLIGQGLRVMVLVTTNEELKRLHPAVARPGRCAAKVSFEPLTREEAAEWLVAHGGASQQPPGTLADLYAVSQGYSADEESLAAVGFAA